MNANPSFFQTAADITGHTLRRATPSELRPGERWLAGKAYVFNQDMLNEHLAREAVANAPSDVSVLTDGELKMLQGHCACFALKHDLPTRILARAVIAEQSRRGMRAAFEGRL